MRGVESQNVQLLQQSPAAARKAVRREVQENKEAVKDKGLQELIQRRETVPHFTIALQEKSHIEELKAEL